MLHVQTILQHFYKMLMWQIFIDSYLDPLLTLHIYSQIITDHYINRL